MIEKTAFCLIFASAVSNALGSIVMKHAYGGCTDLLSAGVTAAILRIALNPWIIAGFSLFGISFFFMAAALSRAELTLAYPMMSAFVYILLTAAGFLVFHENITMMRAGGMALIVAGIVMLAV
ncbi:MAG: hypothetical protein IJM42_02965 [Synergistes sp.]|nr:hypothetical protein [Synergistes sp.]MCR5336286.1 hypothetical protein [Synergistes sp.]